MNINWTIKHFDELSAGELYKIFHLRLEIFAVEQNCVYQDADGKDLQSIHVTGSDENGELLAYARIVLPGISYKEISIGRVITAKKARGTGLGKMVMIKTLEFIKEKFGAVPVRISAQCYLKKFYADMGFIAQGKDYIEDHIPHIEMLKEK